MSAKGTMSHERGYEANGSLVSTLLQVSILVVDKCTQIQLIVKYKLPSEAP